MPMNSMLTLVSVPCLKCGSTADTIRRDRELLRGSNAVCCSPAAPALLCWLCGNPYDEPLWAGHRVFCGLVCYRAWAE